MERTGFEFPFWPLVTKNNALEERWFEGLFAEMGVSLSFGIYLSHGAVWESGCSLPSVINKGFTSSWGL